MLDVQRRKVLHILGVLFGGVSCLDMEVALFNVFNATGIIVVVVVFGGVSCLDMEIALLDVPNTAGIIVIVLVIVVFGGTGHDVESTLI